jgi:hypothetical protein
MPTLMHYETTLPTTAARIQASITLSRFQKPFAETMARKEDESYESDGGETEDEEVKRNCIMGESGMRDCDFFDSDSEVDEEENEVDNDEKMNESSDGEPKEDQTMDLVKFVSLGSQFLKPKGVVLYRPTPIVASNSMTSHSDKSVEIDEDSNESNLKR